VNPKRFNSGEPQGKQLAHGKTERPVITTVGYAMTLVKENHSYAMDVVKQDIK